MKSYRLIKMLHFSEDSNKDIALRYDAGEIESKKYGKANLAGHFLLLTRHGEFPAVNEKEIEERAYIWLTEMGLQEHQDEIIKKIKIPTMIAYAAADADADKLELYFKTSTFMFILDDDITKLNHLHKNNTAKQQEDKLRLVENLISIMENSNSTATAAFKLNPMFKSVCTALSHVCRCSFQQMNEHDYKRFARELMDFIRVNKWIQEYHNSPYTENDYFFLRYVDIGVIPAVELICLAKDIRISSEISMHPFFKRYLKNVVTCVALTNDILSLGKEIADNEKENFVLVKCEKYSLQRAFRKTEKAVNEMIIDLKKSGIKLKLYFPSDYALRNYIKAMEVMIDGFVFWQLKTKRYGNMKYEKYEVQYDFDWNSLLEKVGSIKSENMKELVIGIKNTL